jgi:hypothetical protein
VRDIISNAFYEIWDTCLKDFLIAYVTIVARIAVEVLVGVISLDYGGGAGLLRGRALHTG